MFAGVRLGFSLTRRHFFRFTRARFILFSCTTNVDVEVFLDLLNPILWKIQLRELAGASGLRVFTFHQSVIRVAVKCDMLFHSVAPATLRVTDPPS